MQPVLPFAVTPSHSTAHFPPFSLATVGAVPVPQGCAQALTVTALLGRQTLTNCRIVDCVGRKSQVCTAHPCFAATRVPPQTHKDAGRPLGISLTGRARTCRSVSLLPGDHGRRVSECRDCRMQVGGMKTERRAVSAHASLLSMGSPDVLA